MNRLGSMPSNPDHPTRTYLPLCSMEARNALDLDPRVWKVKDQKMQKHIKASSRRARKGRSST